MVDVFNLAEDTEAEYKEANANIGAQSHIREDDASIDVGAPVEPEILVSHKDEGGPYNIGRPLFGPLRTFDPTAATVFWQFMEQLTQQLPLNDYGLPTHIYRPDMLDYREFISLMLTAMPGTTHYTQKTTTTSFSSAEARVSGQMVFQELQKILDAATIPLNYAEGFPVLPSGKALWEQLDFESKEMFDAFTNYLDLGGARKLSDLVAYEPGVLKEYYHVNYWSIRVKAFDLFRVAHHQKMKLQRMMKIEDSHFVQAEKILNKLQTYLETAAFDDDNMSPDKAVAMMEKLVKIQRISVGLPANGESKENSNPRNPSNVNVIMQQITKDSNGNQQQIDNVDILRDMPDALDAAQELIIKVQGGGA